MITSSKEYSEARERLYEAYQTFMSTTLDESTPYIVQPFDADAIGWEGSGNIRLRVRGFWSSDPITVYARRLGSYNDEKHNWTMTISHSSGGRDTLVVPDDADAETNFADALKAAAQVARHLNTLVSQLEAQHDVRRAVDREEAAAAREEERLKFEADTPLGEFRAEQIIREQAEYSRQTGKPQIVKFLTRGRKYISAILVKKGERTTYIYGERRITRDKAIKLLSESSHESANL